MTTGELSDFQKKMVAILHLENSPVLEKDHKGPTRAEEESEGKTPDMRHASQRTYVINLENEDLKQAYTS